MNHIIAIRTNFYSSTVFHQSEQVFQILPDSVPDSRIQDRYGMAENLEHHKQSHLIDSG